MSKKPDNAASVARSELEDDLESGRQISERFGSTTPSGDPNRKKEVDDNTNDPDMINQEKMDEPEDDDDDDDDDGDDDDE